jgi:YVTN family beta-propeller protein
VEPRRTDTKAERAHGVSDTTGTRHCGSWGRLSRALGWRAAGLLLLSLLGVTALRTGHTRLSASNIPVGAGPSAIAVDDQTRHAFVTNCLDDTVTMFDTASGAVLRTIAVGQGPSAVVVDERAARAVVLNRADDSLSLLDTATGTLQRTVRQPDLNTFAVDEQSGHLFLASGADFAVAGTLTMLDLRSGLVLHTAPLGGTPGWFVQSIAIDPRTRRVLVPLCANGIIGVFDTASGRALRPLAAGGCPEVVGVDAPAHRLIVTIWDDATVRLLDDRSGVVLHTATLSPIHRALAVDAHTRRVFVADDADSTVSVLDARTGDVLQVRAVVADVSPAMSCLHATGEARLRGSCVYVVAMAAEPPRGRVFILTGRGPGVAGAQWPGGVSVLDVASGRLRRSVTVGISPVAMAVDDASGHLFVVNQWAEEASGASQTGLSGLSRLVPSWLRHWVPWLSNPAPATPHGCVSVLDL